MLSPILLFGIRKLRLKKNGEIFSPNYKATLWENIPRFSVLQCVSFHFTVNSASINSHIHFPSQEYMIVFPLVNYISIETRALKGSTQCVTTAITTVTCHFIVCTIMLILTSILMASSYDLSTGLAMNHTFFLMLRCLQEKNSKVS